MQNLFKVDGQTLTPIEIYPAVSDTVNYLTFAFMFSYDWAGLTKSAIFTSGASIYEVPLTNDEVLESDHVNLSAGVWEISVVGDTVVDAVVTRQITTSSYNFNVTQASATSGGVFPPSIASQVYVNVNQSTPQELTAPPTLKIDRVIDNAAQIVDKKYVDQYALGGSGFAANLYFTTIASGVAGYKKISYIAEATETELTIPTTTTESLVRTYLYDDGLGVTVLDGGKWSATYRAKCQHAAGASIRLEAFLYHVDTTETTLFSDTSDKIINTAYATLEYQITQPSFECLATDRLGFRMYVSTTRTAGTTLYTIVGDGNASYVNTPIALRHNQLRGFDTKDHPASAIIFTPVGTMVATDVQAAIAELYAIINPS